jgi:hypothetical protein
MALSKEKINKILMEDRCEHKKRNDRIETLMKIELETLTDAEQHELEEELLKLRKAFRTEAFPSDTKEQKAYWEEQGRLYREMGTKAYIKMVTEQIKQRKGIK